MSKSYSVTSAGVNPEEDRAHRMRMYFIAMSLRVLCVVSLFWVRGWWVLLAAAGAVFLPWFAVMVGNAVAHNGGEAPDAPEPLQLAGAEPAEAQDSDAGAAGEVIVIDVEPLRRAETGAAAADPSTGVPAEAGSDDPASGGPSADAPGSASDDDAEGRA